MVSKMSRSLIASLRRLWKFAGKCSRAAPAQKNDRTNDCRPCCSVLPCLFPTLVASFVTCWVFRFFMFKATLATGTPTGSIFFFNFISRIQVELRTGPVLDMPSPSTPTTRRSAPVFLRRGQSGGAERIACGGPTCSISIPRTTPRGLHRGGLRVPRTLGPSSKPPASRSSG